MLNVKLFNVVGIDDLDGYVFARCTTMEKALRAKTLLEAEGFEDVLDIVPDEIAIDMVVIDEKDIEL